MPFQYVKEGADEQAHADDLQGPPKGLRKLRGAGAPFAGAAPQSARGSAAATPNTAGVIRRRLSPTALEGHDGEVRA